MKVIGLLLTWNNLEFFKCSLTQALEFCDEVILVEGCHSCKFPKRSTDGTCEYIETMRTHPKLQVADFSHASNYQETQRLIRAEFPKHSPHYKPGNWVFHWDDDVFFIRRDLQEMRHVMERTDRDSLSIQARHFFYNFRFNIKQNDKGWVFRVVDGSRLKRISSHYYSDDTPYNTVQMENGIIAFHYGYVKRPERMKARWTMSVEKGTSISKDRFEKWMGVSWDKDEDIHKSKETICGFIVGGRFNIYNGIHPEALDNHPWRHIDDVRKME